MSEVQPNPVIQENVGSEEATKAPASGAAPSVPTPDPAAAGALPNAKPETDFSREFAALTKQKREQLQKEKELKEKWALVEKYEKLEAKKKDDPYGYMEEQGIDFDTVTQSAIRRLEEKKPETVEEKLARLEAKLADDEKRKEEEAKKSEEDKQKAEIDKQVSAYWNSLTQEIDSKPDEYEQILLENAQEEVMNYVIGYFNKTQQKTGEGVVLSVTEAATQIENYLVEQNRAKFEKYQTSKKLGLKKETDQPTPAPTRSMGATLTQQITPSSSAPAPRNESPEEKKRRIAAQFNANLKK